MSDDTTSHIDEALGDYSRQHQPADQTGFAELVTLMTSAAQIKNAARTAGFSEGEAFQLARDFLNEMFRASARVARE